MIKGILRSDILPSHFLRSWAGYKTHAARSSVSSLRSSLEMRRGRPAGRQYAAALPPGRCTPVAGLASDTAHATKAEISESLDGIQERLNLGDVYEGMRDMHCQLQALTAFYESHYVCFCFSQAAGQWIHYDDDTRRVVSREFDAVKEKCILGRLHPQLLFYSQAS